MKHIKTKMLTFTSVTIFLSCLLINLISTVTFSRIYMKELYLSCESQVLQIQQSIDQVVQAVEDSMRLILTSQETMEYLTQTDFSHPDGKVYEAYQQVDWMMSSFQRQFPQFKGLLFFNGNGSMYKYNYYNPMMYSLDDFVMNKKVLEGPRTDRFCWEGIYPINNQLAEGNAYVVTRTFVDYQDLKDLGVAVILLDDDVFSSIYQPMVETSGASVYLLDENYQPIEPYDADEVEKLAGNLEEYHLLKGSVYQVKAADNRSLLTFSKSAVTGWTVCVEVPFDILTDSIQGLVLGNAILSICVVVLFGLFLFRYIAHITDDIARVSDAMQVVEENNFSLRLHTRRKDEIGLIFEGFNVMAENLGKYFQKAMDEEKSKNDAEIRAMFYQIKPHFLYNTLASIRMFAMKQGCMEIVDMLGTLNRLLRNTINIKDHFIPVEEELRNLKDYIKIYNVRYNNRIQFTVDAPEDVLPHKIPNMIIQPMVENAIEHGVSSNLSEDTQPATIGIRIFRQEDILYIQVRDNGAGMTDMELSAILSDDTRTGEREGHIGIQNIDSRLKILYGEDYGVDIKSKKNEYTCVTLKLKIRD